MKHGRHLMRGIQTGIPIAVGYFPIAIAFGALANQAQLTWLETTFMSLIVYAGASQFVGVSMILAGSSAAQIIAATFFINLRHLIMSLAVNDRMRHFPPGWKRSLSFGITDESFALLTLGADDQSEDQKLKPIFVAGLMSTAYLGWVTGTAVGGLGARFIPSEVTTAMTIGLYGLFIGLLVPPARKSLGYALTAIAGMVINGVVSLFIEPGWSIIIATILAAGIGILLVRDNT